jgi:hypothetical protein
MCAIRQERALLVVCGGLLGPTCLSTGSNQLAIKGNQSDENESEHTLMQSIQSIGTEPCDDSRLIKQFNNGTTQIQSFANQMINRRHALNFRPMSVRNLTAHYGSCTCNDLIRGLPYGRDKVSIHSRRFILAPPDFVRDFYPLREG